MLTTKTRTTIAAIAAVTALGAPTSALAERSPTEWRYSPENSSPVTAQPYANHAYDLNSVAFHGFTTPHSLVNGFTGCNGASGSTGVQPASSGNPLQWGPSGRLQWEFRRQAPHPMTFAITGTERVALYNRSSHAYLVDYAWNQTLPSNNLGPRIKLGFSTAASYEWQVADGQGGLAELYNINQRAYLVSVGLVLGNPEPYCGIDLTWQEAPFSLPSGYQAPPNEYALPTQVRAYL